jgi:isopenicillin N synthase-like dioxygenase
VSYATAQSIDAAAIPVIDLRHLNDAGSAHHKNIAAEFLSAARDVGFFYVKNHGVSAALIEAAFSASAAFFSQSQDDKNTVRVSTRHRGFLSVGQTKMQGSATQDLKESFIWGREFPVGSPIFAANSMIGPNQWPAAVPQMPQALNEYLEACVDLGKSLLRIFAMALDRDQEYFTGRFEATISRGSALYYPPQPPDLGDKQFGVAPHTDYGCLTLLYQDDTGGLQVLGANGQWINATPIEGTYVVNVGDLLARWTNDQFRSTPHRVINSSGRARQSLAVFVDPNFDTPIVPVVEDGQTPKYQPTTCGAYILSRFDKSFSYRKQSGAPAPTKMKR